MNESPNRRSIYVGIFVFTALIFLITGILLVGNLHDTFKNKMKVVSFFNDVGGLKKGSNIWFSGVKIGTVGELHFYGKSQVQVSMNIETKVQQYIRKDAMVKISSDGLIGNKILIVYGGTNRTGEIQEGDTLGVEKTFSSEEMINMLQENNKNILAITTDFKAISKKLAAGEGTLGKLLNDNSVYTNINATTVSLQLASVKARLLIDQLAEFSSGLNKKGTLLNELISDTVVFNSVKVSVIQLQRIADTATLFISNLKLAGSNPKTPLGVLMMDETTGARLKETIRNLESSSVTLDEDLKAVQSSFLLKGYFKKKAKAMKADDPTH